MNQPAPRLHPDAAASPASAASPRADAKPIFRVEDLAVSFNNGKGPRIRAVDGVRMSIFPNQTLAVVGESGCGKSVTAMSSLQLVPSPPGRVDRGEILYTTSKELGWGEVDLTALDEHKIRQIRGNEIAMIFQEPMSSLNPVYNIGDQITEAILLHQRVNKKQARDIAIAAMTDVGIPDPERRLAAYPHEFSGGMRQRVMIAMALSCQPRLLLADEPTTALDVTIQKQILDLLADLKRTRDMAIMLITHDLGVVAENADVVCVMYAGRVVEYAPVFELFDHPLHPYTRGLLASIPKIHERRERLITIQEVVSDEAQFRRLEGEGIRPWWPWHNPPEGVHSGPIDSTLRRVRPDHWVAVWATPSALAEPSPEPELTFRRG
ncbi:MAG: ABC transporter ATP-binding protein [Phycisphaerales bacterium JB037]